LENYFAVLKDVVLSFYSSIKIEETA